MFEESNLSPHALIIAERMYDWYLKHPDGFLPKGVTLSDEQLKVLCFNTSLLAGWAVDDELPPTVLDDNLIGPLADN